MEVENSFDDVPCETFFGAFYLGECLDSVLAQIFTDREAICVDDCSTDGSCAMRFDPIAFRKPTSTNSSLVSTEKS